MDSAILAKEALKLSALEKAQIIDALWRSLDPAEQTAVDQACACVSRHKENKGSDRKPLAYRELHLVWRH